MVCLGFHAGGIGAAGAALDPQSDPIQLEGCLDISSILELKLLTESPFHIFPKICGAKGSGLPHPEDAESGSCPAPAYQNSCFVL